ncbi:hypothetical protein GCM10023322_64020 [Rugosimonospora acidiphila]|uniref:Uncharacterized protein n=1 Tax=Rugosimonospora acidiphila TaxID=556531 RepID=A0ABP9SGQ7_9ACTN
MLLVFFLGILVGSLLGWWGSGRWTSFTASDDGVPAAEGFAAGLVAGFLTIVKSAALIALAIVVFFVLAFLIAPMPHQ